MTYPSYCCQRCGALIGWLGRILETIPGYPFKHRCRP